LKNWRYQLKADFVFSKQRRKQTFVFQIKREMLSHSEIKKSREQEKLDEENSYFRKYQNEFAKYIRPTTEKDIADILARNDKKHHHNILKMMKFTSISEEEAHRMRILALEPGMTWRDNYCTIFNVTQSLINILRKTDSGVDLVDIIAAGIDDAGYLRFENVQFNPRAPLFEMYTKRILSERNTFMPDCCDFSSALQLIHVNAAVRDAIFRHEVMGVSAREVDLDKEDGSPCAPWDRTVCVLEGICGWNSEKQAYQLFFPMSALRLLFYECKDEVLGKTKSLVTYPTPETRN
jgi:hypothetical protein